MIDFVPKLRSAGVKDETIGLADNSRRFLAFVPGGEQRKACRKH